MFTQGAGGIDGSSLALTSQSEPGYSGATEHSRGTEVVTENEGWGLDRQGRGWGGRDSTILEGEKKKKTGLRWDSILPRGVSTWGLWWKTMGVISLAQRQNMALITIFYKTPLFSTYCVCSPGWTKICEYGFKYLTFLRFVIKWESFSVQLQFILSSHLKNLTNECMTWKIPLHQE